MRTAVRLVVTAALAFSLVGCDQIDGVVDGARSEFDSARDTVEDAVGSFRWCTAALRLGSAVASRDVESARAAAEDLSTTAPEELRAEVNTIVAAVEEAEATGSTAPIRTDAVKAAGESILTYSQDRCIPGDES